MAKRKKQEAEAEVRTSLSCYTTLLEAAELSGTYRQLDGFTFRLKGGTHSKCC